MDIVHRQRQEEVTDQDTAIGHNHAVGSSLAHTFSASSGGHPFITTDRHDEKPEDDCFNYACCKIK